nr:hypothetical protein [Halomonas sp. ANAO-440]
MNKTTVVAMFIPTIQEWAAGVKLLFSKLLMPLSYTAFFGGAYTLIGTVSNWLSTGSWFCLMPAEHLQITELTLGHRAS